ncbi:MAG: PEFG-CTERM sorting domain-containing protein [Nitrososphaera sp.]
MAILLSSVAAVGMLGTAHAQTGLTVAAESTDENTVTISGNIGTTATGQPLLLQVYNPNGAAYRIDQIPAADIAADGSYSYELKVGGNLGINGEYDVRATYSGVTRETTFNFTGGQAGSEWDTIMLVIGDEEFEIQYMIDGGTLEELTGDFDTKTITAVIGSDVTGNDTGELKLRLPRDVADSKSGEEDDAFVVFVDGEDVTEDSTDDMGADVRELAIPFFENSETVEIVGTFLVPEFGAIAAIVLAVAIVGIIVATTRSGKFSFLPKM